MLDPFMASAKPTESEPNISQLKETFFSLQTQTEDLQTLMLKREALLEHRLRLEATPQRSEEEETLLQKTRQAVSDIDHEIDHLEELTEHSPSDLRRKLIQELLKHSPNERLSDLQHEYHSLLLLEDELQTALAQLGKISEDFNTLEQVQESVKRQNILSYIFGKNPNMVAGKALTNLAALSEVEIKRMETLCSYPNSRERLQEILQSYRDLLQSLYTFSHSKWNFKTVRTFLEENRLESHQNKIERELKMLKNMRSFHEAEIDRWIENFQT